MFWYRNRKYSIVLKQSISKPVYTFVLWTLATCVLWNIWGYVVVACWVHTEDICTQGNGRWILKLR